MHHTAFSSCTEHVRACGGLVRQSDLVAAGFSKRDLADAVRHGRLLRVRRSWLAAPDADRMLLAAARDGVTLSCITRARRLGLWVLTEDRAHVAVPRHSGSAPTAPRGSPSHLSVTAHWARPVVPRHPHALEDSIENALVLVALCQPRENALVVWESALRKGLIDRAAMTRLQLPATAREVLDEADPFADSGLETFVPRRLRWLKLRIVAQAWILGHHVDFLIADRLVLQIDGGHHVGAQRESDIRHDAELMLRGYHVIRVGYRQVVDDWPSVQDLIMRAVAQGLHRAH